MLYILATQISNYANGLTETLYQLLFSSAFANFISYEKPPKTNAIIYYITY